MNKEKINAGIDRMAEEAKETMNLMSDKIDRATRCIYLATRQAQRILIARQLRLDRRQLCGQ